MSAPTLPVLIDVEASLAARDRQHFAGMVKTWEDAERYQAVIDQSDADVLIECGTFSGKSALWFADQGLRVITIDTGPQLDPPILEALHDRERTIRMIVGSTVHPDTITAVRTQLDGMELPEPPRVMVSLDSDHSAAHVLKEIELYGPLVTAGCYMVVEDGLVRWMDGEPYDGSPLDAIEQFLAEHGDTWERDTDLEQLHPQSQFPAGWLRRCA